MIVIPVFFLAEVLNSYSEFDKILPFQLRTNYKLPINKHTTSYKLFCLLYYQQQTVKLPPVAVLLK